MLLLCAMPGIILFLCLGGSASASCVVFQDQLFIVFIFWSSSSNFKFLWVGLFVFLIIPTLVRGLFWYVQHEHQLCVLHVGRSLYFDHSNITFVRNPAHNNPTVNVNCFGENEKVICDRFCRNALSLTPLSLLSDKIDRQIHDARLQSFLALWNCPRILWLEPWVQSRNHACSSIDLASRHCWWSIGWSMCARGGTKRARRHHPNWKSWEAAW